MDKTNTKMAGVYGFLLLAWWGGWLTLDAWRIEYLLTNVDKWEGFRRDILLCVLSAMFSVLALMMHSRKKNSCLVISVHISAYVDHHSLNRRWFFFYSLAIKYGAVLDTVSVVWIGPIGFCTSRDFLFCMS